LLGTGEVFGTSGAGSTVNGISGIFSSGRTLALGVGVSVAAGNGGSWAKMDPAQQHKTIGMIGNFIRRHTCPRVPPESQSRMSNAGGNSDSGCAETWSMLSDAERGV
jgi:hypothetical protein